MLRKMMLVTLAGMFGVCFAQQVSGDSLGKMLEHAKVFYNSGEYERAIRELEKATQYLKQLSQIDQVEAYKYLAFSYVAFGDKEKAKEQFRKALALDPDMELDPATVSPKIIKIFEEVKSETPVKPPVVPPVKPYIKPSEQPSTVSATLRSCCVPGWGQMYKGDGSKGMKLMIASGVLLPACFVSITIAGNKHDAYLRYAPGEDEARDRAYKTYKTWYNIEVFSILGFTGVYLYNLYDVMFTKVKTGSSMNTGEKGFYCDAGSDNVRIGYNLKF